MWSFLTLSRITSTTFNPSDLEAHPEVRPEAQSKAPPATPAPANFKNSLRVRGLFGTFLFPSVQAEQVGDGRGEQGQAEDIVRAAHTRVSEEDDGHHQRARKLEKDDRLSREFTGHAPPDNDEDGVGHE